MTMWVSVFLLEYVCECRCVSKEMGSVCVVVCVYVRVLCACVGVCANASRWRRQESSRMTVKLTSCDKVMEHGGYWQLTDNLTHSQTFSLFLSFSLLFKQAFENTPNPPVYFPCYTVQVEARVV